MTATKVIRHRALLDPDPGVILAAGDRISVLTRAARPSPSGQPRSEPHGRQDGNARMAPPSRDGDDGRPGD
jgi:hypothetical protein